MKFVVSSSELMKGMLTVSKAFPLKAQLSILEDFLFEVKGDSLVITVSDLELTLRSTIKLESSEGDESVAVPRQMLDLLKEIPDQPVTIQSTKENYVECSWKGGSSTLPTFNAGEYPQLNDVEDGATTVVFPAQTLLDGINSTIYAAEEDEMRPVMNGILFDMGPSSTTLVASDSRKLICFTTAEVTCPEPSSFILHKKPAGVLRSIIGKEMENVEIRYDAKNAIFSLEGVTVICRLIVGKYPRYRDVIPQNNSNILKINRAQLANIIKRVSVCSNKASNSIKLDLSPDNLEVSAQDLGFSISAHEKTDCKYDGENLQIGFKSSFLIEILNNISCDEVIIKFSDERRAALLLPAEDSGSDEKICALLMPVQI